MNLRCDTPDLPKLESITLGPGSVFGDFDDSRITTDEKPYDYKNSIIMKSEES